jgi:competence protein ComEC
MHKVTRGPSNWFVVVVFFVVISSILTSCGLKSGRQNVITGLDGNSFLLSGTVVEVMGSGAFIIKLPLGSFFKTQLLNHSFSIHPGDTVLINGILEAPKARRNPFDFNERIYFHSKGWTGSIKKTTLVLINHESHSNNLRFRIFLVKKWILGRINSRFSTSLSKNFVAALLIGDRTGVDKLITLDFQRTGLGHILAISGLHVGMIAGFGHFIIRFFVLRIPLKPCARTKILSGLSMAFVWIYAILVGVTASVVRASIMISVYLLSAFLGNKRSNHRPLGPLFVALYILLAVRPTDIISAGFQLSFFAVGFILIGIKSTSSHQLIPSIPSKIVSAFSITVFALIGTAPILAYTFGFIPFSSLVFSPVVVLLLSFLIPISLLALSLPWGYSVFSLISEAGLDLLISIGTTGAKMAWIPSWYGPIHSFPIEIWLLTMIFLLLVCGKRSLIRGLLLTSIVLISLIAVFIPSRGVIITFLDVGQGDAIVLETPNGRSLIIDVGPSPWSGQTVYRHLQGRALIEFYDVLLSHGHQDHIGGLPSLIKEARLDRVLRKEALPNSILHGGWISSKNPKVQFLSRGNQISLGQDIRLYVLNPIVPGKNNNDSIVLEIVYGKSKILIMGDAELGAESNILNQFSPLLEAQVLKVGHHGSRTSTSERLLTLLKPESAVISAGTKNAFGHPHFEVVNRLKKHKSTIFQTSEEGAILVQMNGISSKRVYWR